MVGIFDPACELLPPWTKELYLCTVLVYCCPSAFSLTSSPSSPKCSLYTASVWRWGGCGMLNCTVEHILQEFYTLFLTRFKTYKIASPPHTKMTSKDDIKGLVSLKFLRPWYTLWYWILVGVLPCTARSWWFIKTKRDRTQYCSVWGFNAAECPNFDYWRIV